MVHSFPTRRSSDLRTTNGGIGLKLPVNIRADLKALPGSSGSSRPQRLVDDIGTRLRRLDLSDLDEVTPGGRRAELAELLDGLHADLRDLSDVITTTHLALPGGMQPLWGPDVRRVMP